MNIKNNKSVIPLLLLWAIIFTNHTFSQGYLCAVGGGSENYSNWSDIPYRWMVEKSGKGPALVMHYSEGSTWLENYFKSFGAASAQSLVIGNKTAAGDSANYRKIIAAKLIFLRGGDQSRYYNTWKGTLVEQAIMKVFRDGGVVGGSSAGLAVLGGIDYTANTTSSAVSSSSLTNPFHRDITLADDFLPFLPGVIFDSHLTARGRIGRLMAFVANWNASHIADIIGIGVDERTAVCIEPDGESMVAGAGAAYIIHANSHSTLRCEANQPLFFTDWTLHALTQGFRYDVVARELTVIAEGAQTLTPSPLSPIAEGATLLLGGGESPSEARSILQQLVDAAGDQNILLLGGSNGAAFRSYLTGSLKAQQVELVTLAADNIELADTADKIGAAAFIIVAGFSADETNTLLAQPNAAQRALLDRCRGRDAMALVTGPAVAALGSLYLKNPDSAQYDLQNGRLVVADGMGVLPQSSLMPQAFYYDDYIENRVGGLYWSLYKNSSALGLQLDNATQVKIEQKRLIPSASQPVLVTDTRGVTVIDTSDYRYRAYYPPRQTAAFYGAVLHCLCVNEEGYFDLENRKWLDRTHVRDPKNSSQAVPDHFHLGIYPNPACDRIHIRSYDENPRRINELCIFNILGQLVMQVADPFLDNSIFTWDGLTANGGKIVAGPYLLRYKRDNQFYHRTFIVTL